MASGNAHRSRNARRPSKGHDKTTCLYCKHKPKVAKRLKLYKNKNGHRHNPGK